MDENRRCCVCSCYWTNKRSAMKNYQFTVKLIATDITDSMEECLYSVVDDALLYCSNNSVALDFDRDSDSLETAIRSAITNIENAGLQVDSIIIERE